MFERVGKTQIDWRIVKFLCIRYDEWSFVSNGEPPLLRCKMNSLNDKSNNRTKIYMQIRICSISNFILRVSRQFIQNDLKISPLRWYVHQFIYLYCLDLCDGIKYIRLSGRPSQSRNVNWICHVENREWILFGCYLNDILQMESTPSLCRQAQRVLWEHFIHVEWTNLFRSIESRIFFMHFWSFEMFPRQLSRSIDSMQSSTFRHTTAWDIEV